MDSSCWDSLVHHEQDESGQSKTKSLWPHKVKWLGLYQLDGGGGTESLCSLLACPCHFILVLDFHVSGILRISGHIFAHLLLSDCLGLKQSV